MNDENGVLDIERTEDGTARGGRMARRARKGVISACPRLSLLLFALAGAAGLLHLFCVLSEGFSDLMNRTVSHAVRIVLAKISGIAPFSLAETVLFFLPVLFILMLIYSVAISRDDSSFRRARYFFSIFSVLSLFYTIFVFTMIPGYNGTALEEKLSLERTPVTAEQLAKTAERLAACAEAELDEITFISGGASVMEQDVGGLSEKICLAFTRVSEQYGFIPTMNTRIKALAISDLMTYTHIAGVYTYYTGEANLNVTFPDYTIPFTTAHELSHQRGIAREDEANFIAFLVCAESGDPYVRYSGYLNLFEYVTGALYEADAAAYRTVISGLDERIRGELSEYGSFFEKYDDSAASKVSGAVNDTYLKLQGDEDGAESYGRVVDLAVAYFEAEE